jgi:hypothetical protein
MSASRPCGRADAPAIVVVLLLMFKAQRQVRLRRDAVELV